MIMEASSTAVLAKVVTTEMLTGVLSEVTSLLPITIPVMITFIGIRKGIAFVQSMLHAA
jgi:hypothetical protein